MATNTAASFSTPTANGTAGPFNIGFTYLAQSEIDVTVDGVLKTLNTHYIFHSTTQISFTSGNFPTAGQTIKFQRNTDISAKKVDFVDGSVLTETDLDNNTDQILFGLQEFVDELNTNVVKKDAGLAQITDAANLAALTDSERLILDGATVSTTELNTLDGVNSTLTASELNVLDGITASTANLNQLTNKEVETSLTANSDAKIPTSKAVNDRILTVTNALGGFVAIANETSFPSTHPDPSGNAGTVVSVSDAGGVVVNSSGVATITNGAGSGNTVTINSFPSDLQSKTLGSGVGLQVQTTSTLHTYTYHKVLLKESDLINLSNDIDDFGNRYRVVDTTPTSNNDEGDLIFRKSDNKLLVFNGTAYQEASSVGNFHTNTLSSFNGTGGGSATFNGSAYRFNINHPPELAEQLLVSINGVIQKPNNGSSQPSEGFALSGSSIIFSAAPASGSDFFIITIGKSVDIGVVSDGTINNAKVASDASIEGTKINPNFGSQNIITSGTVTATSGVDFNDNVKARFGTGNDLEISHTGSSGNIINTTGLLKISASAGSTYVQSDNNVWITKNNNAETMAKFSADGPVELYFDNSKKFQTTATGGTLTGSLRIDEGAVDGILGTAFSGFFGLKHADHTLNSEYMILSNNTDTFISASSGSSVRIRSGGNDTSNELKVGSNGVEITAEATINGITVGKGANSVAGNTVLGESALDAAVSGGNNIAIGKNALTANTTSSNNVAIGYEALTSNTTGNGLAIGYQALDDQTTGTSNLAIGFAALSAITTQIQNVAIGEQAAKLCTGSFNTVLGHKAGMTMTTASNNVAVGAGVMAVETITGDENTGVGSGALARLTSGSFNTGIGRLALHFNSTASHNTAVGNDCLVYNTTGGNNTALGSFALEDNTTGTNNVAVGYGSLRQNITGLRNTAIGDSALQDNTTSNNTAIGSTAARDTTTGQRNVAIGEAAFRVNTTGSYNIAIGQAALIANTTASNNTGVGYQALASNTTGAQNVALGASAFVASTTSSNCVAIGHNALTTQTVANDNVAVGKDALKLNTTGAFNTALGKDSLESNTTGAYNTATGVNALKANTTASKNVAIGYQSFKNNETGSNNTVIGYDALGNGGTNVGGIVAIGYNCCKNTTNGGNTAVGNSALLSNTGGYWNTAFGSNALAANTTTTHNSAFGYLALTAATSSFNDAFGWNALLSNTTGHNNAAFGISAGRNITTGAENVMMGSNAGASITTTSRNVAIGREALKNINGGNNVSIGYQAIQGTSGATQTAHSNVGIGYASLTLVTSANKNVAVGYQAGDSITTGENNIIIGYGADASSATVDDEITLGDSNIATLRCNVQTISSLSDARDKTNVIDLPEGLDFITKLRPVKFEWATRDGNGKDGSFEHGFIAQDLQTAQKENDADYLNMVMDENPNRLEASYGKLVPILVKAIQELTMEVNKLKSNG